MSTSTVMVGRLTMLTESQARPGRYPDEFETWVRHQHRTWANVRRNAERTFEGIKLHAANREGWEGIRHPFSREFEDFLKDGLKEMRLERQAGSWRATEARYQRVEEALEWLQRTNPRLARVALFYSEPFQEESVVKLAQSLSVSEDQPRRMFRAALKRLWWYLGGVW